ncbi:UNVERIFIED_CONTAM: F-box/FBD/LRR-repeat protein [Sesamum indicum]
MVRIIEGESSSSNRRRRPVVRGTDRLSALPQHILTEILSRLSTIEAHSFLRFVDWTVAHHDESDVKIFELQLGPTTYCEVSIKYQWVEFAIQHNVQKLVLHGRVCGTQNLADSIFSCRSLVKLELSVHEIVLSWPETIQLPNLKKLKLKFLLLPEMITSQDLFSNFPALEKLSMFFCNVASLNVFSISSSRLTEFTMSACLGMESCSIRLQTPSLSKFIYTSWDPRESVLHVPPCAFSLVVDGDDSLMCRGSPDELSQTVVKLTRELLGTSYITTGRWLIQYLSMVPNLPRRLASVRARFQSGPMVAYLHIDLFIGLKKRLTYRNVFKGDHLLHTVSDSSNRSGRSVTSNDSKAFAISSEGLCTVGRWMKNLEFYAPNCLQWGERYNMRSKQTIGVCYKPGKLHMKVETWTC